MFSETKLKRKSQLGHSYLWTESGSAQFHFEEDRMVEDLINKYGKENIAAEAQRLLEETTMNFIFGWTKKMKIKKIACAGGIFLNVKLYQRIWNSRNDLIEEQHIYPNPDASGLAVGASLLEYYKHNKFILWSGILK